MKRDLTTASASKFATIADGTHFLFLDRPEHGRTEMVEADPRVHGGDKQIREMKSTGEIVYGRRHPFA